MNLQTWEVFQRLTSKYGPPRFVSKKYVRFQVDQTFADVRFFEHGQIGTIVLGYIKSNGKEIYHCDSGPAFTDFRPDGNLNSNHYYFDNLRHRTDGPAIEYFARSGDCDSKAYYIDGVEVRYNIERSL
jgi:hypothetical protein